jgi:hypothetical protein
MKLKFLAGLGLMLVLAAPAQAIRRGDQGYGVMVGNPSGVTGKFWVNETIAVDAAVGVARGEFDIHMDLLFHKFDWLPNPGSDAFSQAVARGELPFYFGAGPRLLFEHNEEFGIRFPVGLSYLPKESSWEGFVEVAPVMRATPDFGFNGDFAVGVRYYFQAIRARDN